MVFQSTVYPNQGFGVVGEIFLDGPTRAQPAVLDSASAAYNVFGRAFTIKDGAAAATPPGSPMVVEAGGTGVFAGIMACPKDASSNGTSNDGPLAPTLTVPNDTIQQFLNFGQIVVALAAAANIGDWVYYHNTTGVLATTAPDAGAPGSHTRIYGAEVDRYNVGGSGLAVITLGIFRTEPVTT